MSKDQKETYLFQFETQRQADYWMKQTLEKFESSVLNFDKFQGLLEFDDSIYYFWSKNRVSRGMNIATVYGPEDIYIILDDPHRKRLATFEEDKETKSSEGGQP